MPKPKKEDFTDWCSLCNGKGVVSKEYRQEGRSGGNVVKKEPCQQCEGKKVYFDEIKYLKAVIKWWETIGSY